ncbi:TonB-dependent receptor plug domain-containing protein [Proteiniphilum sp. UBA1028]|uniref:TonB-dependent receptor plug domain-containing protein n=1 Tax=Proteiniphilum sp. UBA1028 TaxID=1947251 RepID=UPI0025F5AC58|nr:TonB-dependent receptor [Proteiniphilum sp. UBA1028]
MNKRTLFLTLCLLTAIALLAENRQPAERNDTVRLDEVIVTGTMPKVNLRNLPMSISVISGLLIDERMQPSLLPLLTEEVPGLFITQRGVMGYGVANGAAGGMSIRGIGGAPTSGVLVLIDGHPQYMGLMGHPLADSYQSMMTERVEVVRGPASVLYGSNAMGGVINIITKKQIQEGLQQSARIMYGSYQTLSAEVTNGWRKEGLQLIGNISYNRSDGQRENMNFDQWNGYAKAGYDISRNWKSFADLNISHTQSSNPGPISQPMIDNDAAILRGVASAAVENEYGVTSGAVKFFYNFGSHKINDGYPAFTPSSQPVQPPLHRFRSDDQMLGFSAYQSYAFIEGNKTTAGFDLQRFGGKAWNKFPDETDNVELADVHLNNSAAYLNLQQSLPGNKLTFNGGIRLDYHEINGAEWIPQLGLSFNPSPSTVLKAIVSKGFRNPTIRELYMFPPQNADLKPERLWNYELSYLQTLFNNQVSLGVNLFYVEGDNMIQQTQPGVGKWENSGEVKNKGIELNTTWQATHNLRFSANYSYLNMTRKILAAPEHKMYASGNYTKGKWMFSSGLQYAGNLCTSLNPEIREEHFLLWNIRVHFRMFDWLNLLLRGENLLDQDYEINNGYPMPGITVFGGMQVNI